MGTTRIRMGLLGSALLAGVVLLLLVFKPRMGPLRQAVSVLQERASAPAAPARSRADTTLAPEGASELATRLNLATTDVHSDLRIIDSIFIAYRGSVHDEDPVGENAEITAALMGRNKLGFAFITPDCKALNSNGELCDRWGTPYFFHQLSGERMEVRSAGPDRKMWTADDEVLTP